MADVEFGLKMRDQVSPAANKAGASLDALARKMRKQQAEQAKWNRMAMRDQATVARQAQRVARQQELAAIRAERETKKAERKQAAAAAKAAMESQELYKKTTKSIGTVIGLVSGAGFAALGAFSGKLFESAQHASALQFSLAKLTGNQDEFRSIARQANDLGLGIESTAHSYGLLLKMQFSRGAAQQWIKLGADMKALGNSAEEVEGILLAVSQIKAKDKLQQQELNQLAERGVSVELIRASLAEQIEKATGKKTTVKDVIKLQESGGINFKMADAAIQAAILKKLHISAAGQAAEAYTKTFAGGVEKGKATVERVLLGLGSRFGKGANGGGLASFFNSLDSGGGSGIIKTLGTAAERLGIIFDKIGPPIMEVISAFTVGFAGGLGLDTFSENGGLIARVIREQIVPAMQSIGTVVGFVVRSFGLGVALITTGIATIVNGITGIPNALSNIGSFFFDVGKNIVEGIKSGFSWAWQGLTNLIPDKFKELLGLTKKDQGIHSPSKLWADQVGKPIAQGVTMGYDKEMSGAQMGIAMPSPGSAKAAGAGIGASINVGGITITVQGGGNSRETAQSVMHELEANLSLVFGRAFAGVGV